MKKLLRKKRVVEPKVEEPKVEEPVEPQEPVASAPVEPVEPPKEVLPLGVLRKEKVLLNGKEYEKLWHSDGTTSIK
jgi:hypothetical protein